MEPLIFVENQAEAVIDDRPTAARNQTVREAQSTIGAIERSDCATEIAMIGVAVMPGFPGLFKHDVQVSPMETTVLGEAQMDMFGFNMKPAVVPPGVKFRNDLLAVKENLAGMILKVLLRIELQADQSAREDGETGISFMDDCGRVCLGGWFGVNCLYHIASERFYLSLTPNAKFHSISE